MTDERNVPASEPDPPYVDEGIDEPPAYDPRNDVVEENPVAEPDPQEGEVG